MIITDRRHLRATFRHMRQNRRLTQTQLAEQLHVAPKTVGYRESGRTHLDIDAVLQTANAFGYDVALLPQRCPDSRPTGTGWPA